MLFPKIQLINKIIQRFFLQYVDANLIKYLNNAGKFINNLWRNNLQLAKWIEK